MIYFKSQGKLPEYSKDFTNPKGAAHDNNGSTYFTEAIEKSFKGKFIKFQPIKFTNSKYTERLS